MPFKTCLNCTPIQGRSRQFHLEGVERSHERGWGNFFWNFCFETVHFGSKVTNAVHVYHHHWFSRVTAERLTFRLVTFLWSQFRGKGLNV